MKIAFSCKNEGDSKKSNTAVCPFSGGGVVQWPKERGCFSRGGVINSSDFQTFTKSLRAYINSNK